jgi:Uncharacterized protein conserved in bacteria
MPSIYKKRALISTITLVLLGIVAATALLLRCYSLPGQHQLQGITSATGPRTSLIVPHDTRRLSDYKIKTLVPDIRRQPASVRQHQSPPQLLPLIAEQNAARYIDGALVSTTMPTSTNADAMTGQADDIAVGGGKVIVISIPRQWMYIYENGKQIANTAIATGRPGLDTPVGTFHIFNKQSPTTFYSRWPAGSPNYFPPTHINYAMEFVGGGYFIHDSSWRYEYGPGADEQHYIPGHGYETGSHGCVNVPLSTMTWLYNWAPLGTTVQVTN